MVFAKRVIRKLIRFSGEPTIDEINEYHRKIVALFEVQRQINQTVSELQRRVGLLSEENAQLKRQLEDLRAEKRDKQS